MGNNGSNHRRRAADIVCLSHLRWDFVYQRPQHLLSRAATNRRVFFVEEPLFDAAEPVLEATAAEEGVCVVVPHLPAELSAHEIASLQEALLSEFLAENDVAQYVAWYYTPMALAFTRQLAPLATVYDCMDELSAFAGAPSDLAEHERELLESADVVFTGGRSLFEAKRVLHPNVHLFPSSVDAEHFAQARVSVDEPEDQRSIRRPRVGYFGVIDERMDLGLVSELAAARPEWSFVFVGPVTKIDPGALPRHANVHYLGSKTYDELPHYVGGWDVATIPFARNDSTRYISPTKTPEYLAAGKPVVSTSIPDVVVKYGETEAVRIADEPAAFVGAVESALAADPARLRAEADELLAGDSWDSTWRQMSSLLDQAVSGGRRGRAERRRRAFDYLVVGAGFAGAVAAERLASQAGARVLVVDRRSHVAGNAYDHHDDTGLLVHRYGPHIFHTNSREVFEYLSHFTTWRPYEHVVRASVDGRLVPIPINLDTINELYNLDLDSAGAEAFFARVAEPAGRCRTSEDVVVSKVGRELYEKFFRNYTRKQWDLDPSELDASVLARVPTRTNRDARYFTDTYQAMPRHGYTRMFERILDHPNVKVMLGTDFREVEGLIPYRQLVYTGPVDEFFDYRYGKLPYRSLEFRFETHDRATYQPAPVVNYPNEHLYTRITEFKYLTGQEHPKTTTVAEYPRAEGDPYYPVPRPENAALYARYKALADATPDVHFVGRLATYKYYNMDQVVAQALALVRRLTGEADRSSRAAAPAGALGRSRVHREPRRGRVLRPAGS